MRKVSFPVKSNFEENPASAENKADQALEASSSAEIKAAQALEASNSAEIKAAQALEASNSAEIKAAQALKIGEEALIALNAILSSRSWRITAPLRLIKSEYKIHQIKMRISIRKLAKFVMINTLPLVLKRKKIKIFISTVLSKLKILDKLKRIYSEEAIRSPERLNLIIGEAKNNNGIINETKSYHELSAHSRRIYLEIKKAFGETR
jgi:hypothetical protein